MHPHAHPMHRRAPTHPTRGSSLRVPSFAFMRAASSRTMPPPLSWRDVKKLVRKLDADIRPAEQVLALETIASLCRSDTSKCADFLAAGAVPSLVYLLGPGHPADVQMQAAMVLSLLATEQAGGAFIIAASGAIPPLVQLLGPGSTSDLQKYAASALFVLAANNIPGVAAIPSLVQLLGGPASTAGVQQFAAQALVCLALMAADNKEAIAAAGAIPPLVHLLGLRSTGATAVVLVATQRAASIALRALGGGNAENRAAMDALIKPLMAVQRIWRWASRALLLTAFLCWWLQLGPYPGCLGCALILAGILCWWLLGPTWIGPVNGLPVD
jgi:hypothetical protein